MSKTRGKSLVIAVFLLVILLNFISADTCAVKPIGECVDNWVKIGDWEIVFEMSDDGNAHVQIPNTIKDYDYAFCCDYSGSNACDSDIATNRIIRAYNSGTSPPINSHAEIPDRVPNIYGWNFCYSGLDCSSVNAGLDCPIGKNRVLSLSADTNAHVGIPDYYSTTPTGKIICCDVLTVNPLCVLENAKWTNSQGVEITEIREGEEVTLSLTGSAACNGKLANFDIYEDDAPSTIVKSIPGIDYNGYSFNTSWKTVWEKDTGWLDNPDPEYKFKGVIDSLEKISPDLKVLKGVCGDGFKQSWEECDDGYTDDWDGCSSDCKLEDDYVLTICEDVNNLDNSDDSAKQVACEAMPEQGTRLDGGCEISLACSWTNNKCVTVDNEVLNPDDFLCAGIEISGCIWIPSPDGICDIDVDFITITYTPEVSPDCSGESPYTQTVPCQQRSKLPFFGFYQMIISLISIMIIYSFLILKNKKI